MELRLLGLAMLSALGLTATGLADHNHGHSTTCPATCEPGYVIVQETIIQDVVKKMCVPAPGTKVIKKWVYSEVDDDFCLRKPAGLFQHAHHCKGDCGGKCPECVQCSKPFCRKQLVKREVIVSECPQDKCVIQTVVEKVPCTVYRKVPCDKLTPGMEVVPVPPPGAQQTPPMPPVAPASTRAVVPAVQVPPKLITQ